MNPRLHWFGIRLARCPGRGVRFGWPARSGGLRFASYLDGAGSQLSTEEEANGWVMVLKKTPFLSKFVQTLALRVLATPAAVTHPEQMQVGK